MESQNLQNLHVKKIDYLVLTVMVNAFLPENKTQHLKARIGDYYIYEHMNSVVILRDCKICMKPVLVKDSGNLVFIFDEEEAINILKQYLEEKRKR